MKELVKKVKTYTDIPVAIGFGISKNEHIVEIGKYADAAVFGAALIEFILSNKKNLPEKNAGIFIENLSKKK